MKSLTKRSLRIALFALAGPTLAIAAAGGGAAQADNPPPPPPPPHMAPPPPPPGMHGGPHWAAERGALLDAMLGGLKAGLQLNPEQEKLWGPFEAAVREAAEVRMHHMTEMMHGRGEDEMGPGPVHPIDRLDAMADGMAESAAALKGIVEAARPLYASLDEGQKVNFDFLSHAMMMLGRAHGHGGWGHPGMERAHPGMEEGHHPPPGPHHPDGWDGDDEE
jgi:hypothetical protein